MAFPLEKKELIAVTKSTGKLKSKMIFHIIFEGKEMKSLLKVITNCLKKAEQMNYNSISFPAIGTGTHGYPPQEAAAGMMKAIEQFSASNPQHVKHIRLVLCQPSAYQEFIAKFRNPVQPGLWQRIVNIAKPAQTWESMQTEESYIAEAEGEEERGEQKEGKGVEKGEEEKGDEGEEIDEEEEEVLETKELVIKIYGVTPESIKVVEKEIYSLIEENFTTEHIDDPYTSQLSPEQVHTLNQRGKQLQVDVKIDSAPINQITLKGDKHDVNEMKAFVIKSFADFEKSANRKREAEQLKREAEQLYTTIKWKRMDSQNSKYFDMETNFEIEMASKMQQSTYTHQDQLQHFTIDFSKSQVTDHNTGVVQKIERCDLMQELQGERPNTWDRMPTDPNTGVEVPVHIVDLKPTDKEYLEVNQMFNKTMTQVVANPSSSSGAAVSQGQPQSKTTYSSIIKIQRIQNPFLYKQYIARRELVNKLNPSGSKTSERCLFHGTAQSSCTDINRHNFNRSYSGKNATLYGKGTYFARDASYSARDTYSPRDTNGYKYIYVARVITGEFTVGNQGMIDAPTKPDGSKYDSVVDSVQNPQIFVVFRDDVAYPEYLITFK